MRLIQALTLSAALALPLAGPVLAEGAVPTITVTGTGTVQAAPDLATLMIGVTTQGETAAVAMSKSKGSASGRGAAQASGLLPSTAARDPGAATEGLSLPVTMPRQPSRAASRA